MSLIWLFSFLALSAQTQAVPVAPAAPSLLFQRQFIANMTLDAWTAYTTYAWGQDYLHPYHQHPSTQTLELLSHIADNGETIVNSLSTLWLMGLTAEFQAGRDWVEGFRFKDIKSEIEVLPSVNGYMGSMLANYALTGDQMFLEKAIEVAETLKPVYETSTGLPYSNLVPSSGLVNLGAPRGYFAPNGTTVHFPVTLPEAGGQHLEYQYLHSLTGNPEYLKRVTSARDFLFRSSMKNADLYPHLLDVLDGLIPSASKTSLADGHFYFNLFKSYHQRNGTDSQARNMFVLTVIELERARLFKQSKSGLTFTGELYYSTGPTRDWSKFSPKMTSSTCYLGAMFAMYAEIYQNQVESTVVPTFRIGQQIAQRLMSYAKNLTETCHEASTRTKTGLIPKEFYFDATDDATNTKGPEERNHVFSPELAETYFTLWRLTKDPKYRRYAWELAQAIQTYTHSPSGGYFQNVDVNLEATKQYYVYSAQQPSTFIGGTLKYLYLIFQDDNVLPREKWVFNAVGQPFPVI